MLMVPGFLSRFLLTHPQNYSFLYGSVVEHSSAALTLANLGHCAPAVTCPDGSFGRASHYQSVGHWFESGGDPQFNGQSRTVRDSLINTSSAIFISLARIRAYWMESFRLKSICTDFFENFQLPKVNRRIKSMGFLRY
ncbi:hypothetical protein Y032_0005g2731 [Ancylostoma ceylanicum]|nr:hypothetical protein Y032_0005g2731 [Ancylostoma ceylanicum]